MTVNISHLIAKKVHKPDGPAVLYGEPSKLLIHEER